MKSLAADSEKQQSRITNRRRCGAASRSVRARSYAFIPVSASSPWHVRRAVADVIHEHVGDRTTVLTPLAQPLVESIPDPRELFASPGGVIEEVEHEFPVEPEACAVV
jgi:hypothetical protein